MPIQRITDPIVEPISLADAKKQCKVEFTDDDDLILALISAARDYAENITERSLCPQTWLMTLDSFPGPSLMGAPFGRAYSIPKHAIVLSRPPVQSITSITYLDTSATIQTMPPADYIDPTNGGMQRVDGVTRVTPVFGQIWPINQPQIGSVQVTYVTGYPNPAAVPPGIRAWLKLRIAALYENREEVVVGTRITVSELPYVDGLLDPYIVRA